MTNTMHIPYVRSRREPWPSASLVVINSSNEVLLVHRNPKTTSFAGMHVFPGGNYDEKQDESYRMTAIRETFEETGLLLASATSAGVPPPSEAVHSHGKTLFRDFLRQHALSADVEALLPFTEWITPLGISRCPLPHAFLRRFPAPLPPRVRLLPFSSSTTQHRLPTPDGGAGGEGQQQEVIEARFVHPLQALAEHQAKQIALMPPQHYILTTLADLLVGREAAPHQRERVERLSAGAFGRMVVCPEAVRAGDARGRVALVFEGDEARGGPKGRVHRSLVLFSPETKLPTEVELLRNFDIFTEVEDSRVTGSTKL
ncbi:hypothetical protein BJV77DRAFT_1059248 [Russula vinacea]|nr:hypothetical protein BJV77DRAFT_1059248 [Russula vinacea]